MLTTDTRTASLDSAFDTTFTWDYDRGRAGLDKLTRRPRPTSGTPRPTSTGRSTSTPERRSSRVPRHGPPHRLAGPPPRRSRRLAPHELG
ncbi:MAG: hypothetical protein R2695_17665 [Acidimicrobiales bacterium]